jgi:hypothetical protein
MRNSDIQIDLNIEVRDDLIIVTQPTTTFHAIYVKPKGEPWIKTAGVPTGTLVEDVERRQADIGDLLLTEREIIQIIPWKIGNRTRRYWQ